jgi:short-subunit dehydrogenase
MMIIIFMALPRRDHEQQKDAAMSSQSNNGTALVTGASSGIGATYADRLARRGFNLILVARDSARLDGLASRIGLATGVSIETVRADLSVQADVQRIERRIRQDETITLLVNNAGIGPEGPLVDGNIDYLDRMIQINVTAVNRLAVAAASAFVARGKGTIVNIASVVALVPEMFSGTYSATKAFVLNLTVALNTEVAPKGVRMQAVLPGLTRTEIFERAGADINKLDQSRIMEVGEMVDAALAGLDQGELVTIPSLPDPAAWNAAVAARLALGPNLSNNHAAERYKVRLSATA